jgi:hypothetical protein
MAVSIASDFVIGHVPLSIEAFAGFSDLNINLHRNRAPIAMPRSNSV